MAKKNINPWLDNGGSVMISGNAFLIGGNDTDAQAFLTAAGITDSTISSAINTLVISLKANSLWTKMKAIYPFVGGTATTHKWNLKDPRDLDAAFRLTFYTTSIIHSATGLKFDVTPGGGYANTYLNPSVSLSQNDLHISVYNRLSLVGGTWLGSLMGVAANLSYANAIMLFPLYNGKSYVELNTTGGNHSVNNTTSTGYYVLAKNNSSNFNYFRNNTKTTVTASSVAPYNGSIYLGGNNIGGSANSWYYYENAFTSIGDNLIDTDASNLYTIVQTFQTTLGRQV